MKENKEIVSFVRYLYKGIKQFGIVKIEDKLKELYSDSEQYQKNILKKKIFNEISGSFGIPMPLIINSKKRGITTQAKVMAIILLNKHLLLNQEEIANLFGNGQSLVSRRIRTFYNFIRNPDKKINGDWDKLYNDSFLEKYMDINEKILKFKNK